MRNTRFLRAVLANLDAPEVELCHNLRPTAADGSLTPVAAPTPVIDDPIPGAHILPGGRISAPDGECEIWRRPRRNGDYIATVDIGGRSRDADFSVICVVDRNSDTPDGVPEVVAQWRGHIDHDLLARKAEAIARFYCNALLVIESNSWETSSEGRGRYLLDMLSATYPNLYFRLPNAVGESRAAGFHTNVRTKPAVIANLIACVRDRSYVERSNEACDELLQYESLPDGSYAAARGCHDDILMTRAIALYVHSTLCRGVAGRLSRRDYHAILNHCLR